MAKMNLVYATDANYLLGVEVSAMSAKAFCSRPEDLRIHVLDCGIPDTAWEGFVGRIGPCVRHRIEMGQFADFTLWHGSLGAYARLCLPELLGEEEWCLYADGDTLFVDDVFALMRVMEAEVAFFGHSTSLTSQPAWFARKGIEMDWKTYVCSGVLLMNLAWMRAHGTSSACFRFLQRYTDAPFPDQDALNVCCKGAIRLLPDSWGDYSGAAFGKGRPGCVHYVGEIPWRLSWTWYLGYSDAAAVWYLCAENLCGISRRKVGGPGRFQWVLGRGYNHAIRWSLPLLTRISWFRKRFPNLRNRFVSKMNRPLLSVSFWAMQKVGVMDSLTARSGDR